MTITIELVDRSRGTVEAAARKFGCHLLQYRFETVRAPYRINALFVGPVICLGWLRSYLVEPKLKGASS